MLSRVAESLYWMGRYVERAEHLARLLGVRFEAMLEESPSSSARGWARLLAALNVTLPQEIAGDPVSAARELTFGRDQSAGILASLQLARDNARQVRDEISSEIWEKLNLSYLELSHVSAPASWQAQPALTYQRLLDHLNLWRGVVESSMHHGEGFHFLKLGHYVERAQLTCALVTALFDHEDYARTSPSEEEGLMLLASAGAIEAFNRVHTARYRPETVAAFLIFDPGFPRSVRYAVTRMDEQLQEIGRLGAARGRCPAGRLSHRLVAEVNFRDADSFDGARERAFLSEVRETCRQIHDCVIATYVTYSAEAMIA